MPSGIANLNGSGPQQVYVWVSYHSYSQAGNYSTWYWECVYKNQGGLNWINDGNRWRLTNFAVSSWASFAIPSSWAGTGDHMLGSGTFTKGHNSDGYLSAGTLSATIETNHSAIGDGTASASTGTPPRIPKLPDTPHNAVFVSATPNRVDYTISFAGKDNGGSAILDYDLRLYTLEGGVYTQVKQKTSGSSGQFFDDLDPSTKYYQRYRARNAIGYSGYTAYVELETLGGIYVSDGEKWIGISVEDSTGSAWDDLLPQISDGTAWIDPLPVAPAPRVTGATPIGGGQMHVDLLDLSLDSGPSLVLMRATNDDFDDEVQQWAGAGPWVNGTVTHTGLPVGTWWFRYRRGNGGTPTNQTGFWSNAFQRTIT